MMMEASFVVWIALCFIVAWAAKSKGRTAVGMFLLSLLLSPIIGFIIVLLMKSSETIEEEALIEKNKQTEKRKIILGVEKKCPVCGEYVKKEAIKCRFCGHKFIQARCPICGGTKVFVEDGYCDTCGKTTFEGEWEMWGKSD